MAEGKVDRRLAAIFMADVVGYSRLMGRDEARTLRDLQEHFFSVINPTVGQFEGRVVKTMGDGFFVTFDSATKAVECAISIQRRVIERTAGVPEEERIRFRIGIHLGEVLITDDDIFGDGVNIAARLQALCEPDGVCLSNAVHGQVKGAIDETFADLGAHRLKNITKPVRAYLFSPELSKEPIRPAFRPFVDLPVEEAPKVTGGCLCGNIRYEITEPELGSMFCQCRMCQKFTGAPIVAGTTFNTEAVHITKGKPKYYKSSVIAERGFCPNCGTGLFYRGVLGMWTKWLMVFTASFDKPENFAPTYHLGIESAMPWLTVQDDLPRTQCKDSPSLVEAYGMVGQSVP